MKQNIFNINSAYKTETLTFVTIKKLKHVA